MESNADLKPFQSQIGQSITCDFDENTWTLKMNKGFCWTGGKFALVPVEQFDKLQSDNKALSDMCDKLAELINKASKIDSGFRVVFKDTIDEYNKLKGGKDGQ